MFGLIEYRTDWSRVIRATRHRCPRFFTRCDSLRL